MVTRLILSGNEDVAWRFPVALAPMFPFLIILLMLVSQLRRQADELERRVMLEALAISFFGTMIGTSAYGLLQRAGMPDFNGLWVGALMTVLWFAGMAIAKRRYR